MKPLKAMGREHLADAVLAAQTLELNAATRRLVVAREGRKAIQQPVVAIMMATGTWVGLELWNLPMATVLVLMILLSRVLFNFGKVQGDYQELVTYESFYWSLRRTLDEAAREVEQMTGRIPPSSSARLRSTTWSSPMPGRRCCTIARCGSRSVRSRRSSVPRAQARPR